jgi:2'-hydroxyisoflavone reductase
VPRVVRASAELGAAPRYLFVSTESVYAEPLPPVVTEESPLAQMDDPTVEEITWETYGPLKVLCERAVEDVYGGNAIVRPGFVVGRTIRPTDSPGGSVARAGGRRAGGRSVPVHARTGSRRVHGRAVEAERAAPSTPTASRSASVMC